MQTELSFYNGADALLPAAARIELASLFARLPVPIWPGKSKANAKLSIMQIMFNALLRELFVEHGWSLEPSYGEDLGYYGDAHKTFCGKRLMVEAEFGNSARTAMDICKFIGACTEHKTMDVGIQVSVLKDTAKFMDSNVALYEDTQKLVGFLGSAYQAPTLLVGLDAEGSETVDIRDFGFELSQLKNGNDRITQYVARQVLGLPCSNTGPAKQRRTTSKRITAAGQLCLC